MGEREVLKRFEVALDISRSISNRAFTVVEGDTGNLLHITLTDNGMPVDLTGCRVLAVFSKSNGTSSQDSGVEEGGVSLGGKSGNEVTISLFNSSFAPGMVECELQVYSGEDRMTLVTSAKFNFNCRRGILNGETVQSTGDYPVLVALIAETEKAAAAAYAAAAATGQAAHASRHAAGGTDPLTPAAIGAATAEHTHAPATIGAAAAEHTHTPAAIGAAAAPIIAANVAVELSCWADDATFAAYPYRAAVPVSAAKEGMYAYVSFDAAESDSGAYAKQTAAYEGGVYIYANALPATTITLLTVLLIPVGGAV
ncbi:MAG: DUF2479 domain-containing protein [Clostridiales bacterium]|nr:DUF2479 domain-containing protein [Clostridiales bacterium]